ncbi:MAG: IclR family transcriptional regulator [Acidimicrobiaceae bacterium]|nr:IclR family transcriptional regulator [Acidimicrobiaceae bacterium]
MHHPRNRDVLPLAASRYRRSPPRPDEELVTGRARKAGHLRTATTTSAWSSKVPVESDGATGGVQSVDRTLQIVELLVRSPTPLGVLAIAEATGLAQATVHRLLRALAQRGWVRQDAGRRYAPGVTMFRLGETSQRHVAAAAQPFLAEAASATGETANLALLEGEHATYVGQVPSTHRLRTFAEVGHRVPLHSTAVGKALVAFLAEAEIDGLLARTGLPSRTSTTITSERRFREELAAVRRLGYAVDRSEEAEGVSCVALPVRDTDGQVVCALSISGPGTRVKDGDAPRLAAVLSPIVERLARSLSPGDRTQP